MLQRGAPKLGKDGKPMKDTLFSCTGEICHSPKELFDLLLSDYQSYMEVELTQGRRELTEDDEKQIRVLCKKYVDCLQEELMK